MAPKVSFVPNVTISSEGSSNKRPDVGLGVDDQDPARDEQLEQAHDDRHGPQRRGGRAPPGGEPVQGGAQMRTFGTVINREFGNVEETGILIATDEILEEKKKRHIETYLKEKIGRAHV